MNEEATERGLLPLTPEINAPKGGTRRNSTGKVVTRTSLTLSKNEGKPLPHYLRASTSSCHDFCKYGRKHSLGLKEMQPIFSKFSGNNPTPEEQKQVNSSNPGERRKKSGVKPKAAFHQKMESSDRPKIIEKKALSSVRTIKSAQDEVIKPNTFVKTNGTSEELDITRFDAPSPSKKVESSDESEIIQQNHTPPVYSIDLYEDPGIIMQRHVKKTESFEDNETAMQKRPSVKKSQLSKEPETVKRKTQSVKRMVASTQPKIKEKSPSPVKTVIASLKPKVKQTAPPTKKSDASAKPAFSGKLRAAVVKPISPSNFSTGGSERKNNKVERTAPLTKKSDASAKPAFSGKLRAGVVKPISPSNFSTGGSGRKHKENKVVKSVGLSKVGEKKVLRPPAASFSPQPPVNQVSNLKLRKHGSTKYASPSKNQNRNGKAEPANDKIKEKIMYIVEPELEKNETSQAVRLKASKYRSSSSSQSSSSSSPSSSSPCVSNHEEEEEHENSESTVSESSDSEYELEGTENDQIQFSKGEDKKRLRSTATVHPDTRDPTPHKLKFRRGKVVNPQSENNGPRRLRFRQGNRMDENQNGREVGRRSFRRRRDLVAGDSNHADLEAQTVVLRHQDMQDKKDTQGLLNHVIEETASKLVETRKSKVKALVGAFETVISLQESRPAASV